MILTYDIRDGFEFSIPHQMLGKMIRCFYDEDGIISAISGVVKGKTLFFYIYSKGVTDPELKPTKHINMLGDNAASYAKVLRFENITSTYDRLTPLNLMEAYFPSFSFSKDENEKIVFWLSLKGEAL